MNLKWLYNNFNLKYYMLNNKFSLSNNYDKEHFKAWLSGFVVGDGYFGIKKNMLHSFNILVKILDKLILENIKYNLELENKIYEDNNNNKVQLHVERLNIIVNKIIPLFKEYPLLSNKFYSFEQWAKSAEIIYYNKDKSLANKFIFDGNLNKNLVLSNTKIPFEIINKSFILGFIEAEGVFSIGKSDNLWKLTFKLDQITLNEEVLKYISKNIETWNFIDDNKVPTSIKESLKNTKYSTVNVDKSKFYTNLNNVTNLYSYLKYNQVDLLYYIICPNLNNIKWYSNKHINFIVFNIALNLLIKGLHQIKEGNDLMLKLHKLCNSNLLNTNTLPWDEYYKLLKIDPIYDLNLPYKINSKNYIMSKRYNKPVKTGVFIYDLNHNFIMLVGGQAITAKYFNVKLSEIVRHIKNNTIFLNKYYLKSYNSD